MGGRGVCSYNGSSSRASNVAVKAYAVAALNTGVAGGTSLEDAISRFREQTANERYEYSAYIDAHGYIHSLASTGDEGSTALAPIGSVAKESNVIAVTHNHPSEPSTGRKWGGPLSGDDFLALQSSYMLSGGSINRMVATAREGTYQARITKRVTREQVNNAISRAEKNLKGTKYQSEWAQWKAVHNTYAKEFAKIGVEVQFTKQQKRAKKLVTQQTGYYDY